MGDYDEKIFNTFYNTFIVVTYVFSNFDVSIIYNLLSVMFVTITAGFSLATYLSLTSKRFKQGIAIK